LFLFVVADVGLVPGDEYHLVTAPAGATETGLPRFTIILDSVGDGTCCSYRDRSAALYVTVDDSNVLIYVR
jgi:hypothetical protein